MAKDLVRDWSWDGCLLALVQDHPVEQHLRLLRPLPVCIGGGGGQKAPHICTPVYPLAPPCSHASPSHHICAVCYCVCCHCKYVPGWKLRRGIEESGLCIEASSLASSLRRACVEPLRRGVEARAQKARFRVYLTQVISLNSWERKSPVQVGGRTAEASVQRVGQEHPSKKPQDGCISKAYSTHGGVAQGARQTSLCAPCVPGLPLRPQGALVCSQSGSCGQTTVSRRALKLP